MIGSGDRVLRTIAALTSLVRLEPSFSSRRDLFSLSQRRQLSVMIYCKEARVGNTFQESASSLSSANSGVERRMHEGASVRAWSGMV